MEGVNTVLRALRSSRQSVNFDPRFEYSVLSCQPTVLLRCLQLSLRIYPANPLEENQIEAAAQVLWSFRFPRTGKYYYQGLLNTTPSSPSQHQQRCAKSPQVERHSVTVAAHGQEIAGRKLQLLRVDFQFGPGLVLENWVWAFSLTNSSLPIASRRCSSIALA